MLSTACFERFREAIKSLPPTREGERYKKADLIPRFLLFSECRLYVYYIPFHYVNPTARVVLMGLTPGWTQMEQAFRAAKQGIVKGLQGEALFRHIATTGSFSGPMRNNLVSMLDGIGLNTRLGIASCLALFSAHCELVHLTSAVSMPIFKNGKNYGGYGPPLLQVPKLKQWLTDNLAMEIKAVPNAVIVPPGTVANGAIQFLNEHNVIDLDRCLMGFPHPSGANGHRQEAFKKGCRCWTDQIAVWFAAHG